VASVDGVGSMAFSSPPADSFIPYGVTSPYVRGLAAWKTLDPSKIVKKWKKQRRCAESSC